MDFPDNPPLIAPQSDTSEVTSSILPSTENSTLIWRKSEEEDIPYADRVYSGARDVELKTDPVDEERRSSSRSSGTHQKKDSGQAFSESPGEQHAIEEQLSANGQGEMTSIHQRAADDTTEESQAPVGLSLDTGRTNNASHDLSELSSDDDEERLDPAWGIKRLDSTQVLQKIHRSPSFPDFVSQQNMPSSHPSRLVPESQAESIMREVTQDNAPTTEADLETDTPFAGYSQHDTKHVGSNDYFVFEKDPVFALNEPANETEDVGTRFEEGLPLIRAENEFQKDAGDSQVPESSFGQMFATDDEAATSFYGEIVSGPIESQSHPSFHRKDTADFFKQTDFLPDHAPESPTRQIQNPVEVAQASGALQGDLQTMTMGQDGKDDDISAMWKAALSDDDFLVEDPDDLLPDSPPDSPSSFLESLKEDRTDSIETDTQRPAIDSQSSRGPSTYSGSNPRTSQLPYQSSNPYAPHQPSTSDLTQLSPTSFGNVGLTRPGLAPMKSVQQHFQRPTPQKAESFADQSKGGYKSPYDLPMDISKPRKRPQIQQPVAPKGLPPPPRSSSMSSEMQSVAAFGPPQSPFSPTNPMFPIVDRPTSSQASPARSTRSTSGSAAQAPAAIKVAPVTFFEELPITARPRPSTAHGRFAPQQTNPIPPPQNQAPASQLRPSPPAQPPSDAYAQYQLQHPERFDPYANVPLQPPPATAATSTRYSPAPPTLQAGLRPTPSPRYSPIPPPAPQPGNLPPVNRYASQPATTNQAAPSIPALQSRLASLPNSTAPPVSSAHSFQPRTSSPLAFHKNVDQPSAPGYSPSLERNAPRPPPSTQAQSQYQARRPSQPYGFMPEDTPDIMSQNRAVGENGFPPAPTTVTSPPGFAPPKRSQTQSPGKWGATYTLITASTNVMQRPASVHGRRSPIKDEGISEFIPPLRTSVRQRGLSQKLNFIEPTDGQQLDDLQRWKGAPIFRFGFGGLLVSSFPRHIPRYTGAALPMMKSSAGEVRIQIVRDTLHVSEHMVKFPGPLRSKSKKKDILGWLSNRIVNLEQSGALFANQNQLPDPRKRHDEKILLWKLVRVMVENDGILEGNAEVQKAVNMVLSPELYALDEASATQYTVGSDLSGIYRPVGTAARSEPVDPMTVDNLRKKLMRGEREKAVWEAVDHRLWAHAMLISSTLDRSIWKQVVQEYVKQEVKLIGANTESLAALYEIFAGNLDESIDELVPPSARAGLQMVSKVDHAGPTKNALDGLDRWRETLSLVLNNRSPDDHQAMAALGRLLAGYGRVEAAHICFLFSRSPKQPVAFAGVDDPQASIVLLGADHQGHPLNFFLDEDAILLTEVFEFSTCILTSNPASPSLPHLQAYKLQRAFQLAETGYKTEAQAYCDAIAFSSKSSTKLSPYYHPQFFSDLDELSRRLKQTPDEGSSSWIAKPSLEKVSGRVWDRFTNFVAGDDSDAESKGSGKEANYDAGPFAKVTGTPNLSRSGSTSDLYGSYPATMAQPAVPNTIAGSRYAPSGQYTARSSSELGRGRGSLDSQRSPPSLPPTQTHRQISHDPSSTLGPQSHITQSGSPSHPLGQSPPRNRYQATPPQTSYMPNHLGDSPQSSYLPQQPNSYVPTPPPETYVPTPPPEEAYKPYMPTPPQLPIQEQIVSQQEISPSFGGYTPSPQLEVIDPPTSTFPSQDLRPMAPLQGDSYGYEPPADTGYVPYQPEPDSDSEAEGKRPKPPKKKSFMNDDDDDNEFPRATAQAPAATISTSDPAAEAAARKRANDTAADDAFRAAAEADAQREKDSKSNTLKPKSSGWFGGWLAKKDAQSLDAAASSSSGKLSGGAEPKVHRANLGENSSFYYDKELKKWVNKKDPTSTQVSAKATPPPPKMGPMAGPMRASLTTSASMPVIPTATAGPGSEPPSRTVTPAGLQGIVHAGANASPNGPPAMQRTDSTDSHGAPPPPTGILEGGVATPPVLGGGLAPPSRPGTGMSNTSSIDDLLGPPGASGRKTIRGKKGVKGRYIDVMAK